METIVVLSTKRAFSIRLFVLQRAFTMRFSRQNIFDGPSSLFPTAFLHLVGRGVAHIYGHGPSSLSMGTHWPAQSTESCHSGMASGIHQLALSSYLWKQSCFPSKKGFLSLKQMVSRCKHNRPDHALFRRAMLPSRKGQHDLMEFLAPQLFGKVLS